MDLDPADVMELTQFLQFIVDWLSRDPGRLAPSLLDYADHPGLRP